MSLRRVEAIGAVAIIVCGLVLHFAYDWSGGSRVVAVFAPVNESVWEHLKLAVVPVIAWGLVETNWVADHRRLWWAKLVEVLGIDTFIVAFFYTYTGAFGVSSVVPVDVLSFFVAVVGGQWLSYRLITATGPRRVPLPVSIAGIALVTVAFGVLTFAPPMSRCSRRCPQARTGHLDDLVPVLPMLRTGSAVRSIALLPSRADARG